LNAGISSDPGKLAYLVTFALLEKKKKKAKHSIQSTFEKKIGT
jgi:hypothetical protein